MTGILHLHVPACDSTQDEVRARLTTAARGDTIAVSADSQRAGRGREGRTWQDPPGRAIMVSVGRQGPLPVRVLDELPRRVADGLCELLGSAVGWKAPNDLVAAGGAKVAGILVDARTVRGEVEHVVVGVGINVTGPPFETDDGRAATTLEALGVAVPERDVVIGRLVRCLAT